LRYDQSEEVTEAKIETLKAYLGSDPGIGAVEEITATVIRRELNLEQNNQRRIRRGAQLLRKPSLPEKKMNVGAPVRVYSLAYLG